MAFLVFFGGIAAVATGLYIIKATSPNKHAETDIEHADIEHAEV